MADLGFKKKERLCNQKDFDNLFLTGKIIYSYPVRCVYLFIKSPLPFETKVAFGANKKNHKKATDRNKIKRILRESYRKNKSCLTVDLQGVLNIMFIYTAKTAPINSQIEATLIKILNEISSSYRSGN